MPSNTSKPRDWVVAGGKAGEIGHCARCGRGLSFGGVPQSISVVAAAMKAFVKVHSTCVEGQHVEPVPANPHEWAAGRDTGTSSLTIYHVMTGFPSPRYGTPRDPADFGRCYRLLKLFPSWGAELHKVGEKFPEWQKLIGAWPELTALYEQELPAGTAPKLYQRIKELTR